MNKILSALFAGAVIIAAVFFAAAGGKSPLGTKQTVSENYSKFCSGCHGANLEKFAAKEWMDEDTVEISYENFSSPLGSDGGTVIVAREHGKWSIKERKDQWFD